MRPRTPPARKGSPIDPLASLRTGAREVLSRDLSDSEVAGFTKYLNLLVKWQSYQRLLGSAEPQWIVRRVLLDSLLFLRVLPGGVRTLLDVGSGAGIPGIPIKLVMPDLELTMAEGRQRRASFLSTAVRELGLTSTRVIAGRLEAATPTLVGQFDAVVARCAGEVESLFLIGIQLLRPGGIVLASGPPEERPLAQGRWVTVPGIDKGETRRFAVYTRPV